MPALPAIDENARLNALRAHAFSDPGALEAFDRLTRIASQVFQAPIAACRHVEEALRQSEARQVAVLRAALDAIIIIDQESHVLQVNPAFESIFAYRAEDVRAAGVPG